MTIVVTHFCKSSLFADHWWSILYVCIAVLYKVRILVWSLQRRILRDALIGIEELGNLMVFVKLLHLKRPIVELSSLFCHLGGLKYKTADSTTFLCYTRKKV